MHYAHRTKLHEKSKASVLCSGDNHGEPKSSVGASVEMGREVGVGEFGVESSLTLLFSDIPLFTSL